MMMIRIRLLLAFCVMVVYLLAPALASAAQITIFFPPEWQDKAEKAKTISEVLAQASGLEIQPRIGKSYPEIVDVFAGGQPILRYVGSFVQSLLHARGLSVPLVQAIDGKEYYTSVLIAPKSAGDDPVAIVKEAGVEVAYAKGASSGESGARAATGGAAAVATNNHVASVNAITAGKAKCAFVKNWWWEANRDKYPDMKKMEFPGVSDHKNPDNILSANKAVSAAMKNAWAFGVTSLAEFDTANLKPSLDLMKKATIDPTAYHW